MNAKEQEVVREVADGLRELSEGAPDIFPQIAGYAITLHGLVEDAEADAAREAVRAFPDGISEPLTLPEPRYERGFTHAARAWYAPSMDWHHREYEDEVMFGLYSPDGGTGGEMGMRWYRLGNKREPRLEAYSDAWRALASMPDLLAALGERDGEAVTPEAFCALLATLGFADQTDVNPDKRAALETAMASVERALE